MRRSRQSIHRRRVALARAFAKGLKKELGSQVREVVLFGSVARGDDGRASDIDVMVEVRRRTRSLEDHVFDEVMEIATDEGELIVPIILSARERSLYLPYYMRQRIRAEGRVLG